MKQKIHNFDDVIDCVVFSIDDRYDGIEISVNKDKEPLPKEYSKQELTLAYVWHTYGLMLINGYDILFQHTFDLFFC